MDWKRLLVGKEPETLFEYRASLRNCRLMNWVFVAVLILILFGGWQQSGEIDRCWDELKIYRVSDSVIGGVPVSNCYIEGDALTCDNDLRGLT